MSKTDPTINDELKTVARVVGGLCMLLALAFGTTWVASLFLPEMLANVAVVFVIGFALLGYGLDTDSEGDGDAP